MLPPAGSRRTEQHGRASIDAPRAASVLCDSTAMATAARGLLRTVVLPPPGPAAEMPPIPRIALMIG
jgi:hypothetical protein